MSESYFPSDHKHYLESEFKLRRYRRPQYSLRAFARDLKISPSSLTDFLKGRIGFTASRIEGIAEEIGLSEDQKQHFLDLCESKFSRSMKNRKMAQVRAHARISPRQARLSLDVFRLMSDWEHLAILELLELDEKYQSPKEIAKSLKIRQAQVTAATKRLQKFGLAKVEKSKLVPTSDFSLIGSDIPSAAIRHYHAQILDKASRALEDQDVNRRDNSSTVFSFDRNDLPEIKQELKDFRLQLMNKYTNKRRRDSLYCLSIQLFDLMDEQ